MVTIGWLADNWYTSYHVVRKAMVLDAGFALRCIDAMHQEAPLLVQEAQRIVNDAFWAAQAERRSRRLPVGKSKAASVVVRWKTAPRPTGYVPNPLLD